MLQVDGDDSEGIRRRHLCAAALNPRDGDALFSVSSLGGQTMNRRRRLAQGEELSTLGLHSGFQWAFFLGVMRSSILMIPGFT